MEPIAISSAGIFDTEYLEDLRSNFSGDLLRSGDAGYDDVRKIWNGMIDRRPGLIARCKSTQDVVAAVNFAREKDALVAVRGGGHNITGNAVCDDGIMIDLSPMKKVKVDPAEKIAVVEMGTLWSEFDAATQEFGLATTGGIVSTTGVAGLTLGGGVGWLVRKHGLSCDNLLSAEIVTADGSVVTASVNEHAELFWGIRGGGGNFGIVTSMKFRLHEVTTVLGGMIIHPIDKAKELIRFHREFMKTAPDELTLYSGFLTTPEGLPVVALLGCYAGEPGQGIAATKPLHDFGTPVADLFGPISYSQMQGLLDGAAPHGNRYYWKSDFLETLADDAIDVLISQALMVPSPYTVVLLEYYGGVSSREPEGGAACPHRTPAFNFVISSNWIDKADDEKNIHWSRNFWEAMQPFSSHKAYVNAVGIEGEDRVRQAYGDSYPRLVSLKNTYDPENFFRMNQNIKPTVR